jgi:hypothetical protein
MRAISLTALTLLLASVGGPARADGKSRAADGQKAPPDVRVRVELFQVALVDDGKLSYLRQEIALDARGPDAAVAQLQHGPGSVAPFFEGAPAIVHSTSWRYESDGIVVLTYFAFGERLTNGAAKRAGVTTTKWRNLPGLGPTDPDKPRPPVLHHEDVLAHGLRHLALLARRAGNDRLADRLSKRSRTFFAAIEPEIAGQIGGVTPKQDGAASSR